MVVQVGHGSSSLKDLPPSLLLFSRTGLSKIFPTLLNFSPKKNVRQVELDFGLNIQFTCYSGVFMIRRLQDDMQFSAAGETLKREYVWKSLTDWKTWIASRSIRSFMVMLPLKHLSSASGNIHGFVRVMPLIGQFASS